jgi:hypothetical protein
MTKLEREAEPGLWSKKIQTRVWISLPGVRKVLIKDTDLPAKAIAELIGDTEGAQNVKGEILPLAPELFGMTVDRPKADATRKIRDKSAAGPDKVVA